EGGFTWTSAETLPNGILRASMLARNMHGAGISVPIEIAVSRPAARIEITQIPATVSPGSDVEVLLEARTTDALGMPCADGLEVTMEPLKQTARVKNGTARFYVQKPLPQVAYAFACGAATAQHALVTGDTRFRTLRVTDNLTKNPVGGVVITAQGRTVGVTTEEGWLASPLNVDEIRLERDGYEPQVIRLRQSHTSIALSPVEGGALLGKIIVLDPAGGGRDAGIIGPLGARSSDYALDVARRVASLLRRTGAEVYMTRYGDTEMSEPQRVSCAEDVNADLLISVSFGSRAATAKALDDDGYQRTDLAAYVGHYPNSAKGAALANAIAENLERTPATPSVAYVVQQTGCPSVLVQPADISDSKAEARFRMADQRRAIAEKICAGIVKYYRSNAGS
ncbi:MAG: N-acetylmuramoyl-L-alanine amidase, partial [Candidatus Hydrogenedentes bacterium]|nr:N-acetylmuramoyl-L-alanine amidase [Candidatus Hydrogenedentota bacterium]